MQILFCTCNGRGIEHKKRSKEKTRRKRSREKEKTERKRGGGRLQHFHKASMEKWRAVGEKYQEEQQELAEDKGEEVVVVDRQSSENKTALSSSLLDINFFSLSASISIPRHSRSNAVQCGGSALCTPVCVCACVLLFSSCSRSKYELCCYVSSMYQ